MTTTIFQHSDLLRHKASLYQRQTVSVCLSSALLSPNTPTQAVLDSELIGYTRFVTTFENDAGSYNEASGILSFPTIEATFTVSLEWQSVFILIGDIVAAIIQEIPPVQILPGQSHTYRITLRELLN